MYCKPTNKKLVHMHNIRLQSYYKIVRPQTFSDEKFIIYTQSTHKNTKIFWFCYADIAKLLVILPRIYNIRR